jgi:hypothetical protein
MAALLSVFASLLGDLIYTRQSMELLMRTASITTAVMLLLGPVVAVPAAAAPDTAGCPPGMHRAEAEGGGVGSVDNATRKAEGEAGGVGSLQVQTRKAEAEGGGVGSVNDATRKAEAENGGVGSLRSAAATPCVR